MTEKLLQLTTIISMHTHSLSHSCSLSLSFSQPYDAFLVRRKTSCKFISFAIVKCACIYYLYLCFCRIYIMMTTFPLVQILFRVVCTEVPPQRNLWFNTRLDIILNVAHKICGPNRTHTKYAKWALIQRKACNIQAKHTDLHQEMAPFCIFIEQLSLKYSSNDI